MTRPGAGAGSVPASLAVLSFGAIVYSLMQSLMAPVLPEFQRMFGAGESGASWLLTSFLLSATVGTPLIGRVGDLYGKRRALIGVMAIFAFGSVVCALADSLGMLIAGRLVQGIGAGAVPLAFGVIHDTFPPARAPGSVGFIASLVGIGAGAGVLLSGPIVDLASIRWLFWGPALIACLDAIAVYLVIPEPARRAAGRVNWVGAALMASGLALLLLALTQVGSWGPGSWRVWATFAAGAALLALWYRSELRSPHPLIRPATVRLRGVWVANACGFLIGFGTYLGFVEIPKFAQAPSGGGYGFDASVTESGLYLLPWTLLVLLAGQLTGVLDRLYGPRLPLLLGTALATASFTLLFFAHGSPLEVLLASAVMGVGLGLALGALPNLTIETAPADEVAVASAVNLVLRLIGGALGAQTAAAILDRHQAGGLATEWGYQLTFAVTAVTAALAFAIALAAPRRRAVCAEHSSTLKLTNIP